MGRGWRRVDESGRGCGLCAALCACACCEHTRCAQRASPCYEYGWECLQRRVLVSQHLARGLWTPVCCRCCCRELLVQAIAASLWLCRVGVRAVPSGIALCVTLQLDRLLRLGGVARCRQGGCVCNHPGCVCCVVLCVVLCCVHRQLAGTHQRGAVPRTGVCHHGRPCPCVVSCAS